MKKFRELKEPMKAGLVLAWLKENEKNGHITFKVLLNPKCYICSNLKNMVG